MMQDSACVSIKPIPTIYKGVQMRSRLEAAVAEVFDSAGIKWLYEVEGYDIDGTWYLPDFYLPDAKQFVECKGILDDYHLVKPLKLDRALHGGTNFELPPYRVVILSHPLLSENQFCAWNKPCLKGKSANNLDEFFLAKCEHCRNLVFFNYSLGWSCPLCGKWSKFQSTVIDFTDLIYEAKTSCLQQAT
jgi:hypothetical protein